MCVEREAAQAGQGQREGQGGEGHAAAGQHEARQVGPQGQGAQMLQHLRVLQTVNAVLAVSRCVPTGAIRCRGNMCLYEQWH